jgi:hypothetical protein
MTVSGGKLSQHTEWLVEENQPRHCAFTSGRDRAKICGKTLAIPDKERSL